MDGASDAKSESNWRHSSYAHSQPALLSLLRLPPPREKRGSHLPRCRCGHPARSAMVEAGEVSSVEEGKNTETTTGRRPSREITNCSGWHLHRSLIGSSFRKLRLFPTRQRRSLGEEVPCARNSSELHRPCLEAVFVATLPAQQILGAHIAFDAGCYMRSGPVTC